MENMPVFVKLVENEKLRDSIDFLKETVVETKDLLDNIKLLSDEEATRISKWKENVSLVNTKIEKINTGLIQPTRL
jgi:hypothetical protein